MSAQKDPRIVYCSRCTWWDDIYKIATRPFPGFAFPGGLPICPKCKAPLYEIESMENWNEMIIKYAESTGDKRYPDFIKWLRSKSFPGYTLARQVYERENPLR